MKRLPLLSLLVVLSLKAAAQGTYSERMAASFMHLYPDSIAVKDNQPARWDYEQGLMLKALERVWLRTANPQYFKYIQKNIDSFVNEDGEIRTYRFDDFNLDNIQTGRALLMLYRVTGKEKYRKAAFRLHEQIEKQPRTKEGGFWHKLRYPNQMWLDGLYMAEPFNVEFGKVFNKPEALDDASNQFWWMYKHAFDQKTGLLYHGWDESRKERWADPNYGHSPNVWSRAVGWYVLALVDVLEEIPAKHPNRPQLLQLLQNTAEGIAKHQDKDTGLWYQLPDKPQEKGNYLEASGSAMFVCALLKGMRLGYLNEKYMPAAKKGYEGMLKKFIENEANGDVSLNGTVVVGGLGGSPYRDGSVAYYLSEPLRKNDLKGVGPFIMASIEYEMLEDLPIGKNRKVALDVFYNNEYRKNYEGKPERFHYTLADRRDSGFYTFGRVFEEYGTSVSELTTAPTAENLADKSVYIIVDPDTPEETEKPNYVEAKEIDVMENWVKSGGTLILMQNDKGKAEFAHFNTLANRFGMTFNEVNLNLVQGTQWHIGKIDNLPNHPMFRGVKQIYMKEIPTLTLQKPAKPILTDKDKNIVVAEAKVGKGRVVAICDPWLYNEYVDGRRIPMEYENLKAAKNLAKWVLNK